MSAYNAGMSVLVAPRMCVAALEQRQAWVGSRLQELAHGKDSAARKKERAVLEVRPRRTGSGGAAPWPAALLMMTMMTVVVLFSMMMRGSCVQAELLPEVVRQNLQVVPGDSILDVLRVAAPELRESADQGSRVRPRVAVESQAA